MLLVNINDKKLKAPSYEKLADWILNSDLIKSEVWGYIDKNNKMLPDAIMEALKGNKYTLMCGDYILKISHPLVFEVYIKFDSIKRKIPIFSQYINVHFVNVEEFGEI